MPKAKASPKTKAARRSTRKAKKLYGQFCMRRTEAFDHLLKKLHERRMCSQSAVVLRALQIMAQMDDLSDAGRPLFFEDEKGQKVQLMDL